MLRNWMYLPAERPNFDELYEEVLTVVETGELRTPISNFPALEFAFEEAALDSEGYVADTIGSISGASALSMGNDGYMADVAGSNSDTDAPPRPPKTASLLSSFGSASDSDSAGDAAGESVVEVKNKLRDEVPVGPGRRTLPQQVNTTYVKEPLVGRRMGGGMHVRRKDVVIKKGKSYNAYWGEGLEIYAEGKRMKVANAETSC